MQIGITVASVSDEYEKDPMRSFDEIKDAGYEIFEISRCHKLSRDDYAMALRDRGIKPIAGHFCWPDFEDDMFEDTIEYAGAFGIDTIVLPWNYPDSIKDYESTVNTAKKMDELAKKLDARGYKLVYHNHWMEFADVYEGKCVEDILLENTKLVNFELDLGWAYTGGCMDLPAYIQKLGSRLAIVHIKDVKDMEKSPVEVGTGLVDIKACLDAAVDVGCQYGIVEQDVSPENRAYPAFESIRISRENLRKMGF